MSDRFPSEIWTRIFLFACTDGGATGCSLGLVSYYIRAAVLPVQLHSVALVSTEKTMKLAALLESRPPEYRRVRHLFLSRIGPNPSQTARRAYRVAIASHDPNATRRVLDIVAPDLLTLTSTLPTGFYGQDRILATAFPSLVELTVHGYVSPDAPSTDSQPEAGPSPPALFPALRYLHVLSSANSCPMFLRHAPALTHLRLSTLPCLDGVLLAALTAFLHDNMSSDAPPFPPSLQRIIIEPYMHRTIRFMMNNHALRLHTAERKALLNADKEHKLTFVGSDRADGPDSSPPYNARKDWENRMLGGSGCWVKLANNGLSFSGYAGRRHTKDLWNDRVFALDLPI